MNAREMDFNASSQAIEQTVALGRERIVREAQTLCASPASTRLSRDAHAHLRGEHEAAREVVDAPALVQRAVTGVLSR
jgi:hypothetical protein